MTQEDKDLLLTDLSSRLLCGVKVYNTTFKEPTIQTLYGKISSDVFLMEETYTSVGVDGDDFGSSNKRHYTGCVDFIKPYLRPMSSMTEEEKEEYKALCLEETFTFATWQKVRWYDTWKSIDWLNKNMFDYRGLIEKELALEAPIGMYNIKKK